MSDEELHRVDIAGVRGAPERRRARFLHAEQIEVVLRVPYLPAHSRVRIRALVEQRLHQIEVGRLLLQVRSRLRIKCLWCPLDVQHGIERRHARFARQVRFRAVVEQIFRHIEMAVDGRDEQGARSIRFRRGVTVRVLWHLRHRPVLRFRRAAEGIRIGFRGARGVQRGDWRARGAVRIRLGASDHTQTCRPRRHHRRSLAEVHDQTLDVPAAGVLDNDTDVDGDPLTAKLVSGPSYGTLTFNTTQSGSLIWYP